MDETLQNYNKQFNKIILCSNLPMLSLTTKKPVTCHPVPIKKQLQILYTNEFQQPIDLFSLLQKKDPPKQNTTQFMIEKFKKQTEQLKQIKKNISMNSVSRLSQMKRLKETVNSVSRLDQMRKLKETKKPESTEKTFYEAQENKNYDFQTGSIRKRMIGLKNEDKKEREKLPKTQNEKVYIEKDNPEDSISEIKKTQMNEIHNSQTQKEPQRLPDQRQIPQKQNSKLQSPEVRQNNYFFKKFYRPSTSPQNNISKFRNHSTPIISHLSNNSKSHRSDQITNKMRIQLRQIQSKQKIFKNKIKLIQKQTAFKLQKKIQQNALLLSKHQNVYEFIQSRLEKERERSVLIKKKKEQKRLIHQSNAMKINITKLSKGQATLQERKVLKSRYEESLLELTYKRFLQEKKSLEKQQNLEYRVSFLRNLSSKNLRDSRETHVDTRSVFSRKLKG